jgi:hypothetical protein
VEAFHRFCHSDYLPFLSAIIQYFQREPASRARLCSKLFFFTCRIAGGKGAFSNPDYPLTKGKGP